MRCMSAMLHRERKRPNVESAMLELSAAKAVAAQEVALLIMDRTDYLESGEDVADERKM